jgi:predicted dehydrogenase
MAKKKLNVAMIGAQFMGKAHSNAWRQSKAFFDLPYEPVMKVICRRSAGGEDVANQWGWEETSRDYKKVVNRPDIDIVDICTPNHMHPVIAKEAAKAGKHVICEKPLANDVKDAKAMYDAVKKAGVKHMCCFSYRFAPAVATIKKMVSSGELGEIFHFRAAYQQDWIVDPEFPLVWRLKKKESGSGALGDIGAHITDLCQYLVGDIGEVCAATQTFIKKRPISESDTGITAGGHKKKGRKMGTVDVDDAAIFLGRIKNSNTLATFEATRFATGRRNHNTIEIYGSKGSVTWNQEDMNFFNYYNSADPAQAQGFRRVHATDGGHPYIDAWWPTGHIIGYEHLFTHQCVDFLSQLKRKKVTYSTFEDALSCQKVLDAVERSAKSKRWEKIK